MESLLRISDKLGGILRDEYKLVTSKKVYVVTVTKSISDKDGKCNICKSIILINESIGTFSCNHSFHYECAIIGNFISCPNCHEDITNQVL
jgi:hypothetical protein